MPYLLIAIGAFGYTPPPEIAADDSLASLVRESELVFEGTASDAWVEVLPDGLPLQIVDLTIETAHKGVVETGHVQLGIPGGTLPSGERVLMVGAPKLVIGADVLVFADAVDDERVRLVDFRRGVFSRLDDKAVDGHLGVVGEGPTADAPLPTTACELDAVGLSLRDGCGADGAAWADLTQVLREAVSLDDLSTPPASVRGIEETFLAPRVTP